MYWQYLVEIRVWFAILLAVVLVGFGYGACWMLAGRPWRKRWAGAERKAEARLSDTNRLTMANTLLEEQLGKLQRELLETEEELNRAHGSERVLAGREGQEQDDATFPRMAFDPAVWQFSGQQGASGGGSDGDGAGESWLAGPMS